MTIYRDVGEKKLKRAFALQYQLKLILRGDQIRTGHNVQGVRFSISEHTVHGILAMRSWEITAKYIRFCGTFQIEHILLGRKPRILVIEHILLGHPVCFFSLLFRNIFGF